MKEIIIVKCKREELEYFMPKYYTQIVKTEYKLIVIYDLM